MLRQLLSAFKTDDTLDRAFSEFSEMLDHAQWMFIRANEVLRHKVDANEVKDSIYSRDQAINELLRGLRRKMVRHLTINPGQDVAACLALMSIAKDAERIGDYCKNVFEVGQFYEKDFAQNHYHDPLTAIQTEVDCLFTDVSDAFKKSDDKEAKQCIKSADAVRGKCDDIITQLLHDKSNMETHEAVAYSLLARHYKRVCAHLANICTGILGRIEDLDFRK